MDQESGATQVSRHPLLVSLFVLSAAAVCAGGLAVLSGTDMAIGWLPVAVVAGWLALFAWALSMDRHLTLGTVGLLPLVVVLAGSTTAPETIRARLSEPALADAYSDVSAGAPVGQVGLYGAKSSFMSFDCAVLVTQVVLIEEYGVAFCESPPPAQSLFTHITGNVYSYAYTD